MTAPVPGDALRAYLPYGRNPHRDPIDWSAAPARFKRYPDAERVPLTWDDNQLGTLLAAVSGLTRVRWVWPTDSSTNRVDARPRVAFGRRSPSGGALYPLETYVATDQALYHYDVAHHALEVLRRGDHRGALMASDTAAETIVVVTSRFWRNAFKYREFGYRLQSQETGVVAAQALAVADQLDVPARVHLLFDDTRVNTLLGLTPDAESAMAILSVGTEQPVNAEPTARPVPAAYPDPRPVTAELPRLAALHEASLTVPPSSTLEWPAPPAHPTGGDQVPLPDSRVRVADGVDRRASPTDGFVPYELGPDVLAAVLAAASAEAAGVGSSLAFYCVTSRVRGLRPSAYRYDRSRRTLVDVGNAVIDELIADGRGTLLSGVPLGEAGFALLPVGSPLSGVEAFGDRWYRMLQTEVGVVLQRAALAAAALGLAARIHSGATPDFTGALGLVGDAEVLSTLVVGSPRTTPDRPVD